MPTISSVGPVAVDLVGALKGDGTVCHPLGINVDGTTVFVDANDELSSFVSVAASGGAIRGNGSVANPLAINVDNDTVTINASNALAANPHVAGAISGTGATATPLFVNVDNSTVKINSSSQLTASLVATTALSGIGTAGNPLGVNVDNSTIKVNASNQLSTLVGTPGDSILAVAAKFVDAPAIGPLFLAPIIIVPAVAGKLIVPIAWFMKTSDVIGVAAPVASFRLVYHGLVASPLPDMSMGFNNTSQGPGSAMHGGANLNWNASQPDLVGKALDLTTDINLFSTFPPSGLSATIVVMYYLF